MTEDKLKDYRAKRDFTLTPEPGEGRPGEGQRFVVQRHQASHLHYDFRLEIGGVLKSWAVPKGPPTRPNEKRLAVEVEDHPLDYIDFQGTIPEGQYGAGTVEIWDSGTFEPAAGKDAQAELASGKLGFTLSGRRLRGHFALAKTKMGPKSWLLIAGQGIEPGGPPNDSSGVKAPMPTTVKPMLSTLVEKPFSDPDWLFEVKWDGVRAIAFLDAGTIRFVSRNQTDLTPLFPELQEIAAGIKSPSAVLDGEIVSLDSGGRPDFQQLQPRLGLVGENEIKSLAAKTPAVYYAFDLLYLDGRDLQGAPLVERRRLLKDIVAPDPGQLRLSDYIETEGEKLFNLAKSTGLEGVMAKRANSRYEQKRSRAWLKIKAVMTQDCVICGFTKARGTGRHFGALVLGLYEQGRLVYVGHTGTGFSEAVQAGLKAKMAPLVTDTCAFQNIPKTNEPAVWLRPRLVGEIKFSQWTKDGLLRHPAFVALRTDKEPLDCVRESAEQAAPPVSLAGHPEQTVTIGERELKLTNLDKIFWPELSLTKRDLLEYYYTVAGWLVPHLAERPMAMKRYPDGIHGEYFWQKDSPKELPSWIATETIAEGGGRNRYILVNDAPTLIYLANLGCIDLNPWSSRSGSLDSPDWLIVDLDPFDVAFDAVIETALACKQVLDDLGLSGYPKTSGATGMHILVPLAPIYQYAQARHLAEIIVKLTLARAPQTATLEPAIKDRAGRVYLDWLQNIRGKTVAAAYAPRPEIEATVSTPLAWSEVRPGLNPAAFTIKTVPSRLNDIGDIFQPVLNEKQRIEPILEGLEGRLRA